MGWKGVVRDKIESNLGLFVFDSLPRGVRWDIDVKSDFRNYNPALIFDVGANVGQSALYFNKCFPDTKILSFEPIPETHARLVENVQGIAKIECHNLALGNTTGKVTMDRSDKSETASIVEDVPNIENSVVVELDTIDSFCSRSNINHLDYLKIDTEGHDLEVLKGASELVSDGKINFIEVEAGMNKNNNVHVPFTTFNDYLLSRDFLLYALYEQGRENIETGPYMRRVNATYINKSFV